MQISSILETTKQESTILKITTKQALRIRLPRHVPAGHGGHQAPVCMYAGRSVGR